MAPDPAFPPLVAEILAAHPWLRDPSLQATLVGSAALAVAREREGLEGPSFTDLDLSWALSPDAGNDELRRHGLEATATAAARARGTLGVTLCGRRVEITTFRKDHGLRPRAEAAGQPFFHGRTVDESIGIDVHSRDMTIGGVYVALADGRVRDPVGGLADWRRGLIRPIGEIADRVREHPVRLLRYFRRAAELGFELHASIRSGAAELAPLCHDETPCEAVVDELRKVLLRCRSPGLFFQLLTEARALAALFPEIAPQFDGRPAGRARYHPEISQGLHLCLALKRAAETARARGLPERDRLALGLAVLCHDLGKGETPRDLMPHHHGHEARGLAIVERFLDAMPSLADGPTRRLVLSVAELHGVVRNLAELRPSTQVKLWDEHFRRTDFRAELFALAVACDLEGRLPPSAIGLPDPPEQDSENAILRSLSRIAAACATVDAKALEAECAGDVERLRTRLFEARCAAIARGPAPSGS